MSKKSKKEVVDEKLAAWLAENPDVHVFGDWTPEPYDVIPSGNLAIDYGVLGIGGFPLGRIVEIYGAPSSGKTTLVSHVLAHAQRMGKRALMLDVEHSFDMSYYAALGGDPKTLLFRQPNSGEEVFTTAIAACEAGVVSVIGIDSVAEMTPQKELDGEMTDEFMGLQARMMGKGLRKLVATASANNVLILFINQTREKLNVRFGSPITTPGGNALKFAASIRVEVTYMGKVKEREALIANKVRIKTVKNKCSIPFREAMVEVRYGHGIDSAATLFDLAEEHSLGVSAVNASYEVFGQKYRGRPAALAAFKAADTKEVEAKVRELIAAGKVSFAANDGD